MKYQKPRGHQASLLSFTPRFFHKSNFKTDGPGLTNWRDAENALIKVPAERLHIYLEKSFVKAIKKYAKLFVSQQILLFLNY